MGTRADFYVGRGAGMRWVGSIAFDGYPSGIKEDEEDENGEVLDATSEAEFLERLKANLAIRDDWTSPEMGWPWPWKSSASTDYAYAFDEGRVWASCFGGPWFDPQEKDPDTVRGPQVDFPDMSAVQKVAMDKRSGLIVVQMPPER